MNIYKKKESKVQELELEHMSTFLVLRNEEIVF